MNFDEIFRIANNGKICSVFPEYTDGFLEKLYDLGWSDSEVVRASEIEVEEASYNFRQFKYYLDKDGNIDYTTIGMDVINGCLLEDAIRFNEDKERDTVSRLLWDRFRGVI